MKTHSKLSSSILALLGSIAISHAETVTWDGTTSGDAIWTDADSNSWSGLTYDNGDDAQFLGDGAGTVTLSGTITPNSVLVNSANDYDFTGVLSGGGSLTKDGSGILTLSSDMTYTGGTTVNGGELQLDSGGGTLKSGTTLTIDGDSSVVRLGPTVFGNNIFGSGALFIQNGGTMIDDTPGGAVHSINNGLTFTNGGSLTSTGVGNGTFGNYYFGGGSGINVTGNAAATISADSISITNGRTITVADVTGDANADLTISSVIRNSNSATVVNKYGAGTLALTTQNTHTGGTTVFDGTLDLVGQNILFGNGSNNNSALTVDGSSSLVKLSATGINAMNTIGPLTLKNGGTFTDNGPAGGLHSVYAPVIFDGGGTMTSEVTGNGGFGNFLFINGIQVTSTTGLATIDAHSISFNFSQTLDVADSVAGSGTDLLISSSIRNERVGNITKNGGGTLELTATDSTDTSGWIVNAGTLEIGGAGSLGSGSYAGTIANSGTFEYNSSADQTLSGVISGTGALVKDNSGTLTLSGTNTYTGATNVNGGVLEAQGGSAIGNSSAVTVNALGTFEVDNAETIGSLTGAGDVTLNANLTTGDTTNTEISGNISGSGTLIKQGASTLTLSGDNSGFSGGITLQNVNSRLALNSANAAGTGDLTFNHQTKLFNGASGPNTINNDITTNGWLYWEGGSKALEVAGDWNNNSDVVWTNSSETLTMSGVVSGSASTGFYGNGTIALTNANNNFTGNYHATLDSTIQFTTVANSGVNSALGAGTQVRFDGGNQSFNGYYENIGAGGSTNRAITIGRTSQAREAGIANNGTGALNFSGTFTNDASSGGTRTLLLGGDYAGENTISSVLSDGAGGGKIALTKEGSTTWTLSGTNTYTGATTVTDGTLIINGDHSGATGEINVSGTGILGGSGTLASMTVALGGAMSPGNSPGTQTIADLTWGDGGSYIWEVNDSNGSEGADPGWDWIDVTTSFDLSGLSAGGFTIDITSLTTGNVAGLAAGFDYSGLEYGDPFATSFTILTLASGNITGFDAGDFVLDDGNFVNGKLEWSLAAAGADLVLSAVFVPEPSSTALLGLGGLALMLRRKRSAA